MRNGRETYTFQELEGTNELRNQDYLNLCTKKAHYYNVFCLLLITSMFRSFLLLSSG